MALPDFRRTPPHFVGAIAAVLLFLAYIPRWLTFLSPMGGSYAYDYFTLPRCGLAVRNATDLFTSSADYSFGYFATNWASHPMLCMVLGVPFSFLPPWFGFWLCNSLYLAIHIFLLWVFGRRLKPDAQGRYEWFHFVGMASLGFFFPWYMDYHLGQYHLVFVLAVGLALMGAVVPGFVISALGKPALAPAALCLFVRQRWGAIALIATLCALGSLPFLLFYFNDDGGVEFGINENFISFFQISSIYSHHSVRGWDQEMGWSKVFDEWFLGDHYPLRLAIMALFSMVGAIFSRKNLSLGIGFASLWFFFCYGRIHEYHYATFVPLLAWALGEKGFSPRLVALGALLMALPTLWPLLHASSAFLPGKGLDFALARETHPVLFWIWMLHRPLVSLFVATLFVRAGWESLQPQHASDTVIPCCTRP